jgi:hypothetical protein
MTPYLADSGKTLLATAIRGAGDLFRRKSVETDAKMAQLLEKLDADGLAVVEGYLPPERCLALRAEMDRVFAQHPEYAWHDQLGSDHRIHAVERFSDAIRELYADPWLHRLGEAYLNVGLVNGFTLAGRLEAKAGSLGSGGGWHRDSCYHRQFKALVYLTDVGTENGPFQYVAGSHTVQSQVRAVSYGVQKFRKTRFTEDEVQQICNASGQQVTEVLAPAGSVLIVNTRGLHRGKPITSGSRYALTNYYFQKHVFVGKTADGWRAEFEPRR